MKEDRLLSFQIVFRSTHGLCCGPLRTDNQLLAPRSPRNR
nr:MAG TPA: hypothetical protein [Bacteriophage sp.]